MDYILRSVQAVLARLIRREPPRRRPDLTDGETDWLPPVIGAADLSSPYFLAMADREAAWYFERR